MRRASARPRPLSQLLGTGLMVLIFAGAPGGAARARAGQTAEAAWQEARRREGVLVELRDTGRRTPDSRGSAVIAYPLSLLREVLLELQGYGRRWPYLSSARLLWRGPKQAVIYCRTKVPFPLSDRDWTMRLSWRDEPGRFVLSWDALPPGAGPPPVRGVVRLHEQGGSWTLTALGPASTRVEYLRHGDMGGYLPGRLRVAAAKEEPVAMIRALRLSAKGWR